MIFLLFDVYGIWEDLSAWKIPLQDMPMICLLFLEFSKNVQNPAAGKHVDTSPFSTRKPNFRNIHNIYPFHVSELLNLSFG